MILKVLVTVMTYPSLSTNYFETVCTAGFREDGSWIRIFPVPYRVLLGAEESKRYHKWQWIEVNLEQDLAHDKRIESYHISDINTLRLLDRIDKKGSPRWGIRLQWVLKNKPLYRNMTELLDDTSSKNISLAVLKPTKIIDFVCEREDMVKFQSKLKELEARYRAELNQTRLFEDEYALRANFQFAEKIPYKFSYVFMTEDNKRRKLMIEDWEIGNLYRHVFDDYQDEEIACQKVKEKYMKMAQNDIYLFLGTSYEWHMKNSPDPYMIIGVFAPPRQTHIQTTLDF